MKTRQLIMTGLMAALTAVGALIAFPLPFSPVPVTLQILFTLMAGVVLGSKYGAISQFIYLLLGGIGLPVFAGGQGGFHALVGPTAGYLWGFVLAAFFVGLVVERFSSFVIDLVAMAGGLIIIYLFGMTGLHFVAGLPFSKAFFVGVAPFIPGDLVKMIVVAMTSQQLRLRIDHFSRFEG